MSKKTYIDELIDFKENVISAIAESQTVIGLIANDPNIDLDSDRAEDIIEENIFDFDYVDRTVVRTDAFVMVETEMTRPSSGMMTEWYVYVQVVSNKSYNKLDKKLFKGLKGNRKDNLVREIDYLLNGSRDFGVGKLELIHVDPATVPDTFTSTMLTYQVVDFRNERLMNR